jgi:opacity protein-like surface antigen
MCLLLMLLLSLSSAHAYRVGVGGFGGLNIPLAQDDAKSGTAYGAKVRITLIPMIAVEPNFTYMANGDAESEIESYDYGTQEREAGEFTSFGIDLIFGSVNGFTGLNVYGIGGISSSKFAREADAIPDLTSMSYWFGLGLEYSVTDQISLDFRGKVLVFPYDDGNDTGSRKNALVTVGLNYYFGEGGGL